MIADIIRAEGPISVERYFRLCAAQYYATQEPFGAGGDFITAPEYSQLFGEMIGIWCATVFEAMGQPAEFALIELGPGRGTLMADVLKASRIKAQVHLVETSPRLRAAQAETLRPLGIEPTWHTALDLVPEGPGILIANEFFDALPIQQLQFDRGAWHERMVGLDDAGQLQLGLSPMAIPMECDSAAAPHEGAILERSPSRARVAGEIARRGLHALIIDYGHSGGGFGDTLQAMRGQAFDDVLAAPGTADITSHVDFDSLARAVQSCGGRACGPLEQGAFLKAMGLEMRALTLSAQATTAERAVIADAVDRLSGDRQMGRLFKVLAITPAAAPAPYPFAAP